MKNDQWTTKEALTDLWEATRLDLIFLQGCDEDWKRQPFGTVLIRTPTVSGGCDGDVPVDDGGSGGGAAADADADAGTPRRDPASDAGESGGGAAAAGGGGGGGGPVANLEEANLEAGPPQPAAAAEAVANLEANLEVGPHPRPSPIGDLR